MRVIPRTITRITALIAIPIITNIRTDISMAIILTTGGVPLVGEDTTPTPGGGTITGMMATESTAMMTSSPRDLQKGKKRFVVMPSVPLIPALPA